MGLLGWLGKNGILELGNVPELPTFDGTSRWGTYYRGGIMGSLPSNIGGVDW